MSDPLKVFYSQPFTVERLIGETSVGAKFDSAVTLHGLIQHENRLVLDKAGNEVTSPVHIAMSATTDQIPVGSRVTVRGRRRLVIVESAHVGGFTGSPDYYSIDLG